MAIQHLYLRAGEKVLGQFPVGQVRAAARQGKLTPAHEGSVDGQTWFRLETIWAKLTAAPAAEATAQAATAQAPAQAQAPQRIHSPLPSVNPSEGSAKPSRPAPASSATASAAAFPGVQTTARPASQRAPQPSSVAVAVPVPEGEFQAFAPRPPADELSTNYAPLYKTGFFEVARIVYGFSGLVYLAVALSIVWLLYNLVNGEAASISDIGNFSEVWGVLVLAALLLDLLATALLLCWSYHVFDRLRCLHPDEWPESFWRWSLGYFVPFMSLFTFADFQKRLWHGARFGRRTPELDGDVPLEAYAGAVVRGAVWVFVILCAVAFRWMTDVSLETSQLRDQKGSIYWRGGRPGPSLQLQQAEAKAKRSAYLFFGLIVLSAGAASGTMVTHYLYGDKVHRTMLAQADPDEESLS